MTTNRLEATLLAAAMLGTVVSVFTAGAWFGEWLGGPMRGLALAAVVDVGMFAAILSSRQDRAALWVVAGLAMVSWLANAQHAMMVHLGGTIPTAADWLAADLVTLANALIITAVAPVAALALAMLYHRSATRVSPAPAAIPVHAPTVAAPDPLMKRVDWTPAWEPYASPAPAKPAPVAKAKPTAPKPSRGATDAAERDKALAMLADGASQAEAARVVGVHPATVGRWKGAVNGANGSGAG